MAKTLIKICGITNADIAAQTAAAGADFIGLIFHPDSPRYVTPAKAKMIATTAKNNGAQPVAVFVNQTAQEMTDICEQSHIQIVQLHSAQTKQQYHLLPDKYARIMVNYVNDTPAETDYCITRDFILFDNINAGQGIAFDWEKFNYSGLFRWFLAGGLNADNVARAITTLKPTGVDVSSGVESYPGIKDMSRIKRFIQAVQFAEKEIKL